MNNQIPFLYPGPFYNPPTKDNDYDKIITKLDNLEKEINDLKKKIDKIEKKEIKEENNDMYFV